MITGEVLLILNGGVQDSISFDTVSKKDAAINQFQQVRYAILHETPNADVRIDVREEIR